MIGWIDASSGASGDMLLGALLGAGADESAVRAAVASVAPEAVSFLVAPTTRAGLAATRVSVEVADSATHRGLGDVLTLIRSAGLADQVERRAATVFERLAAAEAAAHGISVDDVHFHEVGALDAITDVIGVCAGLVSLDVSHLTCSPVAVGSGFVSTSHGRLSVPPPAVAALLTGAPTYGGTVATELCTPTGAALLSAWVDAWGPQPAMTVRAVGVGAGSKDFPEAPNVVRLFVGDPSDRAEVTAVLYETNVDDLDPRLWPAVLARLLAAGAADAWLTPILMKKGRPAYTLSVLVRPEVAPSVRAVIFTETSAIGLRETTVAKCALQRHFVTVEVGGQPIAVKLATSDGRVVNVQPEYDDVVAAASALDRPVKAVLAEAVAAANPHWPRS